MILNEKYLNLKLETYWANSDKLKNVVIGFNYIFI